MTEPSTTQNRSGPLKAYRFLLAAALAVALGVFASSAVHAQTIASRVASTWGLNPGGGVVSSSGATVSGGDVTFTGAGQSVVIDTTGAGGLTLGVQLSGSGTLKVQWSDKPATGFTDGLVASVTNIPGSSPISAISAAGQYAGPVGGRYLKLTPTALTGTFIVTPMLRSQPISISQGGGGSGDFTGVMEVGQVIRPIGAPASGNCTFKRNGTPITGSINVACNPGYTLVSADLGQALSWEPARTVYSALAISGSPPTTATIGVAYSFAPSVSGGATPYGCTSGNLPGWLTQNSTTCAIGGTPGQAETDSGITLGATDAIGGSASLAPFTITVAAASLPAGTLSLDWSQSGSLITMTLGMP
jgi:hypothetical protein